jgi:hypothetical protein
VSKKEQRIALLESKVADLIRKVAELEKMIGMGLK